MNNKNNIPKFDKNQKRKIRYVLITVAWIILFLLNLDFIISVNAILSTRIMWMSFVSIPYLIYSIVHFIVLKKSISNQQKEEHLIQHPDIISPTIPDPSDELFEVYYNLESMSSVQQKISNNYTAYFQNGTLVNVSPRNTLKSLYDSRDIAYNATAIVSDGKIYSLKSPEDIRNISIPKFPKSSETVFSLDYILRMCASNLRNNGYNELSVLVLSKSIELMQHSGIAWQEKDYLRIVAWLYEDHLFDLGDKFKDYIKSKNFTTSHFAIEQFQNLIRKSDLIAFNSYGPIYCEECALYSGRVYSVSGKNKKYPKMPQSLIDCGCYHVGCHTGASCYYDYEWDKIFFKGNHVDPKKSTFRKYVDDRTQEDIRSYEENMEKIRKDDYSLYLEKKREYHYLKWLIPDIMPKSMAAYTRAKNQKNQSFIAIVNAAKEKGYNINY